MDEHVIVSINRRDKNHNVFKELLFRIFYFPLIAIISK